MEIMVLLCLGKCRISNGNRIPMNYHNCRNAATILVSKEYNLQWQLFTTGLFQYIWWISNGMGLVRPSWGGSI